MLDAARLHLRAATDADHAAMGALHAAAYPADPGTPAERAARMATAGWVTPEERVVAVDGAALAGMYALIRFDVWLGGRPVRAGGLAGVAVAPEARGRGVAARLVEHALATCLAESRPVAVLYPFREDFYHRHGFATVYRHLRCRFSPDWLPRPATVEGGAAAVRRATADDLPAIRRAYARFCERTSGLVSRPERMFERRFAEAHVVVVPRGDGTEVDGYLAARWLAPHDDDQTLEVHELVHTTPAARAALLGWLALQRDQVREVRLDVALDDPLPSLLVRRSAAPAPHLRWLHQDIGSLSAGAMMRVLDVPAALLARGGLGDGTLTLRIDDAAALRLAVRDGRASVDEAPAAGAGPRLVTDGRTFAMLYAGALRPSEAAALGMCALSGDAAVADAVLGAPRPLLLDSF